MTEEFDEDVGIEIGPVNMGQTMAIMAYSVRAMIGTFIKPEDSDEDKAKLALICFSTFLYQYIKPAIKPELYIPVLQVMIADLEAARDAQPR